MNAGNRTSAFCKSWMCASSQAISPAPSDCFSSVLIHDPSPLLWKWPSSLITLKTLNLWTPYPLRSAVILLTSELPVTSQCSFAASYTTWRAGDVALHISPPRQTAYYLFIHWFTQTLSKVKKYIQKCMWKYTRSAKNTYQLKLTIKKKIQKPIQESLNQGHYGIQLEID